MTDYELAAEFAVWADEAQEWASLTEAAAMESWDRAVGLRLVREEQQ